MALQGGESGIMAAKPQPIPGTHAHQPIYANGSAPSPQSPQPQSQPQSQSLAPCNSSSYSSSPRQLPSDLPDPILEEGIESGSDYPAEPVTPTSASASGRHSQEWASFPTGAHYNYLQPSSSDETTQQLPANPPASLPKTPIVASESSTPTDSLQQGDGWRPATTSTLYASQSVAIDETEPELDSAPLTRRSTRGSTSSFKRTMSSLFRRSAPQVPMPATQPKDDGVISRISTSAADSTRPRISTATARENGGPRPASRVAVSLCTGQLQPLDPTPRRRPPRLSRFPTAETTWAPSPPIQLCPSLSPTRMISPPRRRTDPPQASALAFAVALLTSSPATARATEEIVQAASTRPSGLTPPRRAAAPLRE
uniref:Uncharacterized protein n=1 Tax=Bionectria ochroleuca TaxID=29856 RepID=A0A8H7K537_BIOOC